MYCASPGSPGDSTGAREVLGSLRFYSFEPLKQHFKPFVTKISSKRNLVLTHEGPTLSFLLKPPNRPLFIDLSGAAENPI